MTWEVNVRHVTVDFRTRCCHAGLWGGRPIARRAIATDSLSLAAGAVVNGLAAYAFVALGTRTYGAEAFAPVSVVWTFWALSVAMFTFPVEHWVIRTVRLDGADAGVRTTLPRLAAGALIVAIGLFAIAYGWRERFFGDAALWWPTLVPVVALGSAVLGYGRGILASRRRYVATGAAIAGENVVRLIAAVVVVEAGGSAEWFGGSLALGVLVIGLWPNVFRLGDAAAAPHRIGEFVAGLGGGVLLAQVALNAPPAAVAALNGDPAVVTGVFAALALFRAPYLISLGLAPRVTGPLTQLVIRGNETRLRRINTALLAATAGMTVAAAVVAWTAGTQIIDVIFGDGVSPSRSIVVLTAIGCGVALGALGLILFLLARAKTATIVVAWGAAMVLATAFLVASPASVGNRVVGAFVVAEIVALGWMAVAERRYSMRSRIT